MLNISELMLFGYLFYRLQDILNKKSIKMVRKMFLNDIQIQVKYLSIYRPIQGFTGADPAFWMTGLLGPHNH
jgi:hypothetical protein